MMKLIKYSSILLFALFFSNLWSQELRIGVDYLSKIRIDQLNDVQRDLIQNLIEDSLIDIITETKNLEWNTSFTVVAKSKINEILAEQKLQEDLSECTDSSCAITLGNLISANYMIYRDIGEFRPGEYNFRISLINIERGVVIGSSNSFYTGDLFDEESIKETFFDLMVTLFNEAFQEEREIATSSVLKELALNRQSLAIEKQLKEEEGGFNWTYLLLGVLLLAGLAG
ncbi:MAG: hypothetical protein VW333_13005, partial [Pseudomonadales bacterium]